MTVLEVKIWRIESGKIRNKYINDSISNLYLAENYTSVNLI